MSFEVLFEAFNYYFPRFVTMYIGVEPVELAEGEKPMSKEDVPPDLYEALKQLGNRSGMLKYTFFNLFGKPIFKKYSLVE